MDKLFKERFAQFRATDPKTAEGIADDLLTMAGLDEDEMDADGYGYIYEYAAILPDELVDFQTACGSVPNAPFADGVAINFLKEKGVDCFYAIVMTEEDGRICICSAECQLTEDDAEKFSEIIGERQGSLREDNGWTKGWSAFESE